MSETLTPSFRTWLATPMRADLAEAVERIRLAPDVQHVAVMPDVHLASDTCIGAVRGLRRECCSAFRAQRLRWMRTPHPHRARW